MTLIDKLIDNILTNKQKIIDIIQEIDKIHNNITDYYKIQDQEIYTKLKSLPRASTAISQIIPAIDLVGVDISKAGFPETAVATNKLLKSIEQVATKLKVATDKAVKDEKIAANNKSNLSLVNAANKSKADVKSYTDTLIHVIDMISTANRAATAAAANAQIAASISNDSLLLPASLIANAVANAQSANTVAASSIAASIANPENKQLKKIAELAKNAATTAIALSIDPSNTDLIASAQVSQLAVMSAIYEVNTKPVKSEIADVIRFAKGIYNNTPLKIISNIKTQQECETLCNNESLCNMYKREPHTNTCSLYNFDNPNDGQTGIFNNKYQNFKTYGTFLFKNPQTVSNATECEAICKLDPACGLYIYQNDNVKDLKLKNTCILAGPEPTLPSDNEYGIMNERIIIDNIKPQISELNSPVKIDYTCPNNYDLINKTCYEKCPKDYTTDGILCKKENNITTRINIEPKIIQSCLTGYELHNDICKLPKIIDSSDINELANKKSGIEKFDDVSQTQVSNLVTQQLKGIYTNTPYNTVLDVKSQTECLKLCADDPLCEFYTRNTNKNTCSMFNLASKEHGVSGVINNENSTYRTFGNPTVFNTPQPMASPEECEILCKNDDKCGIYIYNNKTTPELEKKNTCTTVYSDPNTGDSYEIGFVFTTPQAYVTAKKYEKFVTKAINDAVKEYNVAKKAIYEQYNIIENFDDDDSDNTDSQSDDSDTPVSDDSDTSQSDDSDTPQSDDSDTPVSDDSDAEAEAQAQAEAQARLEAELKKKAQAAKKKALEAAKKKALEAAKKKAQDAAKKAAMKAAKQVVGKLGPVGAAVGVGMSLLSAKKEIGNFMKRPSLNGGIAIGAKVIGDQLKQAKQSAEMAKKMLGKIPAIGGALSGAMGAGMATIGKNLEEMKKTAKAAKEALTHPSLNNTLALGKQLVSTQLNMVKNTGKMVASGAKSIGKAFKKIRH
jgi:hypothetical protein